MNFFKGPIKKISNKLRHNVNLSFSGELTKCNNSKLYKQIEKNQLKFMRSTNVTLAVVIHLFYVDNWPLFVRKLTNLNGYPFDMFITIPQQNIYFKKEILKAYPTANIIVVPNHGRDVLPFIKVAKKLYEAGYESVLKFHSKKSTHREDGQEWLDDMLNKLLPDRSRVMDDIYDKLQDKNTGILGPEGVYYPLTVNFPANGVHMTRIIKKLYDSRLAHKYLQLNRNQYGFFGGTMFWARLDAIKNLLVFPVRYFETEAGQIDGTLPHALERLFTVVPEIDMKTNYEINDKGVVKRPYMSTNIPDWSEDHLK